MLTAKLYVLLAFEKAKSDLIAETRRGYLGILWWFLEPILYLGVFYIIFVMLFNRGGASGVVFLLTGLVVWKWFANGIAHCANSIAANAGLIHQVYLPKLILPFMALLSDTFKFFLIFSVFLTFLFLTGYTPVLSWFMLPLIILIQFLVILAIGSFLAAIVPFVPDVKIMIEHMLTLLLFLSGIFFDISHVPEDWKVILSMNPMLGLIDAYRAVLIHGDFPAAIPLLYIVGSALLLLFFSIGVLIKYDRLYPKII